ncbi:MULTISPECIES: hypothetical protein [Gibbsiella]|nr:hypothetical protein [Gibbsiella quercinecans]
MLNKLSFSGKKKPLNEGLEAIGFATGEITAAGRRTAAGFVGYGEQNTR